MNKITVKFHGDLKSKFGDDFKLYADSANEALHSLFCQIEGLKDHVKKGWYELRVGKKVYTEEDLQNGIDVKRSDVVHLTPKIQGAGKFGAFIAGAVLVVIGVIVNIYSGWGTPFIQAGIGLMVGGVAQMLVKQPKSNTNQQGIEDSKSSAFSNLSNMPGQGKQLSRIYGEIDAGSFVASEGMSSYRPDSSYKPLSIETPTYKKTAISTIKAKDRNGQEFNTDTQDESVREAAVVISTEWS